LYGALEKESRGRFMKAMNKMALLIADVCMHCPKDRVNEVCRAFDVAYFIFMAEKVVTDDPRAIREQREKFRNEKLNEILDVNHYLGILSQKGIKENMECALMYKALCQPDFDYFGAAHRQVTMYKENQEEAEKNSAARGEVFNDIMHTHRWNLVYAYHAKHRICPGRIKDDVVPRIWHRNYPYISPADIPHEETPDIDFMGHFIYRERGKDILDLVKDRAIMPKRPERIKIAEDVQKLPLSDRNYLVDAITRTVPIDLRDVAHDLSEGNLNLDVRADDKAEAAKKYQRLFFELGTEGRLALSQYEESIAEYAMHVPGCFAGRDEGGKISAMNKIVEPISAYLPYQVLNVSLDIKKFSPYLPARLFTALDKLWSEAFGKTEILGFSNILKQGNVHYIKGCVHHVFPKQNVDFEGFFGRKLTVYHCSVMSCVVKRLRRAGIVGRAGRFACLIDDGLLRLDLGKGDFANKRHQCLREIEMVYGYGAMRISWDKAFTSSICGTFLHEVRVHGRSMTAGYRAALKINNRADGPSHSLLFDLQRASSSTTGAIKAGAPTIAAYGIYLLSCLDAMYRWRKVGGKFKSSKALWLFAPVNLGGLGLESVSTISASTRSATLTECVGHLELIGYRYPDTRRAIMEILDIEARPASDRAKLVDPLNIVTYRTKLRSDRFTLAIERSMSRSLTSPVLAAITGADLRKRATFASECIAWNARIPAPIRALMEASDVSEVIHKIAVKFLTARSASILVPFRAQHLINIKNRTESEKVLSIFE
jgi:hypothetical protein